MRQESVEHIGQDEAQDSDLRGLSPQDLRSTAVIEADSGLMQARGVLNRLLDAEGAANGRYRAVAASAAHQGD